MTTMADWLPRCGSSVRAQIVAHPIGIPDGAGEQALHPIGTRFSGVFGQLPAVFARGGTEDAVQSAERSGYASDPIPGSIAQHP